MSKHRRSQQQQLQASTESLDTVWALSATTASVHTASTAGAVTAVRGWTWAIGTLAQSLDSDRRCNVNIVDSIVLASELQHTRANSSSRKDANKSVLWLTTHKNGAIARKKRPHNAVDASASAFPAAEVSERFVRLASQWAALGGTAPPGAPPFIAVLVRRNGARQLLEPAVFQELLDVLEASGSTSSVQRDGDGAVAGLQTYVPPARGSAPSFVSAMYTSGSSPASSVATASHVDVVYRDAYCSSMDRGVTFSGDAPPQASRLRREAERAVLAIVDVLQRGTSARIQSASFEFVVDCEHKLWLTHVDRIEVVTQLDERSSSEAVVLGTRKQSLPTLPSAHASGIASSTSSSSDVASAKCRGEFCQTAPSQLPGLFFLSSEHASADSADDNNSSSRGSTEHLDTQALPDTGQRFKIGNNNVQLARAERRFLLGTDDSSSTSAETRSDRALRWQEADGVLRAELGRSNPTQFYKQVPVCSNCYRIYSELNKVRDNGFRAPEDVTPRGMKPSRSTSALSKSKVLTKPPTTTQQDVSSANDPSTDAYDQLFLAELAKHSDDASAARPELEDAGSRPSSRSERPSLPSLTASTGTSAAAAASATSRSKKTKPKALNSSSSGPAPGLSLARPSSSSNRNHNNQASSSALGSDDDTLRLVSTLRTRITALEDALAASETQRQQLEHRIVQTQTQCTAMLSEKDAQMRTQRLELELAFSTKQSQQQVCASESSASAVETSKLIETIEALSAQIDALQVTKEREKRAQSQLHQSEIKRLHDKYQSEMETLRLSEHAAKERVEAMQLTLVNAQNQAQVAATQARSAKAALEDLTATTLAALEEKNRRLERQVTELRATAQQQQQASQSSSSHGSSATAGAAATDLEALEKHMENKVTYLKAQLASEMKCKEELGQHLAHVTATIETLKRDKRQALADQDEAFKRQLARLESSFAHDKDVLVAQHAALQAKVVTLQANVTDLVQEVTLWQSKDANAKLALDKMVEENVRQTRQIVDLEAQVEALQDERQRHASAGSGASAGAMSVKTASDETQRMQMEALLRRVDNERQYVKNQLENEQAMREKSQQHAAALQRTVSELQQQLSDVSSASDAALRAAVADAQRAERAARDSVECLEESKRLLARQLSDVQVKFATAREQALLDRDELEKMRILVQDAQSELSAARDELTQERERSASASTRSAQALALVKRSLHAMETESARRVQRLEDEAAEYMRKLADAQAEMLVLQDKSASDRVAWTKQLGLTRLALVMNAAVSRYSVRKQHSAFSQLVLYTHTQQLCTTLEERHGTAMRALDEQLRREFMDKCDDITQRLLDERMDAVRALTARFDADRAELQQCFDAEKTQLLADADAAQQERLQALKEAHAAAYSALEAQSADAREQLDVAYKTLERERDALAAALAASQQQSSELEAERESVAAVSQHAHDAAAAQFAVETRARERAHAQALEDAAARAAAQIAALEREHTDEIRMMTDEHAEAIAERVQAAIDETHAAAQAEMEALRAAHADALATAHAQHEAHVQDEVAAVTAQWQRELEHARALGEQTLQDAVARAERKAQAQLEALERELSERKGHAIVQCTSKWQRALEELQTRMDVEKQVAYDSGVRDRESEWQLAATQIKQQQKDELARVQHEALRAIQAAEERHAMQFTAQLAQRSRELEAAHAAELIRIEREVTECEQRAADERVAAQVALVEQALAAEHTADVEARTAAMHETHAQALAAALATYESDRHALLAQGAATMAQALADAAAEWERKLEALGRERDAQTQQALDALRDELASDYDHDTQQLRASLEHELAVKLAALETRLLREQDDAVAQVQDDSERLIEQVERAMTELKAQKDAMERELTTLRRALEAAEDAQFDATEQLAAQRKRAALDVLALVAQAIKRMAIDRKDHAMALAALQQTLDASERSLATERAQWRTEYAQLQAAWRDVAAKHDEMRATLTTYKREELVTHRSASGVLANELAIVATQMSEVREMKAALERDVEALEAEAQRVDASVRQLMAPSESSASLNMAVVAKKRRLNEEFEALLEQIERKRAELRGVDATLSALQSRRESKEMEMKAMERKLVEILVQQQKRLLALLAAVRELPVPASLTAQQEQEQQQQS